MGKAKRLERKKERSKARKTKLVKKVKISNENTYVHAGTELENSFHKTDLDEKYLVITFNNYLKNNCGIPHCEKSELKKVFEIFKEFSCIEAKEDIVQYFISLKKYTIKPIYNKGSYRYLFSGIGIHSMVHEIKLSDSGRIFFKTNNTNNHIEVLQIKRAHNQL